ncbi:hypothetical protein NPIL_471961 [Nephila pilipes]|uniref:Uncharacterized protein n=1 Tax=Nephila pilipes TaxID=299642 RepID=A0A8X6N422_NEPPI|nr:hypothetical protein NPIL_471961 [Nephila pilipes]
MTYWKCFVKWQHSNNLKLKSLHREKKKNSQAQGCTWNFCPFSCTEWSDFILLIVFRQPDQLVCFPAISAKHAPGAKRAAVKVDPVKRCNSLTVNIIVWGLVRQSQRPSHQEGSFALFGLSDGLRYD